MFTYKTVPYGLRSERPTNVKCIQYVSGSGHPQLNRPRNAFNTQLTIESEFGRLQHLIIKIETPIQKCR